MQKNELFYKCETFAENLPNNFLLQVKIEFSAGKYKKLLAIEEVEVDDCTICKGFVVGQYAQQDTFEQCEGVDNIPRFFEEKVCFNYSIVYSFIHDSITQIS